MTQQPEEFEPKIFTPEEVEKLFDANEQKRFTAQYDYFPTYRNRMKLTITFNDYQQVKPIEPGWYLCVVSETHDLGTSQYYVMASWANYADYGNAFDCSHERGLTVLYWAELQKFPIHTDQESDWKSEPDLSGF